MEELASIEKLPGADSKDALEGDVDAENRNNVINVYRSRGISTEFSGGSEVQY